MSEPTIKELKTDVALANRQIKTILSGLEERYGLKIVNINSEYVEREVGLGEKAQIISINIDYKL